MAIATEPDGCKTLAEAIVSRLQSEVLGTLSAEQRATANQIFLDACKKREQEVDTRVEQAVEQAREAEQAKHDGWLGQSADKPGNKRLKRKGY